MAGTATAATSAHNTFLKVGDGSSPEVFSKIAEVMSISGGGIKLDTKEVTHQDSPDHYREKIATLLSVGDITFGINFLPQNATHSVSAGLVYLQVNRTNRNFQIVMTDAGTTTWTFPCYVTDFSPDYNIEDQTQASVTLTVNGKPTLT